MSFCVTCGDRMALFAIHKHIENHGIPPTIRGLCELLGCRSTNAIADRLDRLVRHGFIEREFNLARAMRITNRGVKALKHPTEAKPSRVSEMGEP